MPKILIAIASCKLWEDNGNNQAVRDTWKKDVPADIDCVFFQGEGSNWTKDTIVVDAPDDYHGIIRKTQAIHSLAYNNGYDFVFQCWPDTYVNVPFLLKSGFEKHDYFGHSSPYVHDWFRKEVPQGYLGGGEGWWTSRRACEIIMKAEATTSPLYNNGAADDLWWGFVLAKAGIKMVDHPDYGNGITLHGSVHTGGQDKYDKNWMYATYDNHR
jgi:hypothetical protein